MTNRIGYPDPDRFFWQGSSPWGSQPWGHGGLTVGRAGCPGAALAIAQILAHIDTAATPGTVAERALRAVPAIFAPGSSAANLPRLAGISGFDVAAEWRLSPAFDVVAARNAIEKVIRDGGFAWLHVDDDDPDLIGNHWVIAYAIVDGRILYADSATAARGELDMRTLSGVSKRKKGDKPYTAVRGYSLMPAR